MYNRIQRIHSLLGSVKSSKFEENINSKASFEYKTSCNFYNKNLIQKSNQENNCKTKSILTANSSIANYATNNPKEIENIFHNYKKMASTKNNFKKTSEILYIKKFSADCPNATIFSKSFFKFFNSKKKLPKWPFGDEYKGNNCK